MDKRQQKILKKMYDDKIDIFVSGKLFPVRKARTCRNCYLRDKSGVCMFNFPQQKNPNYNPRDFDNNQNRQDLIPTGYCVPVRVWHADEDYRGQLVIYELDKILNH